MRYDSRSANDLFPAAGDRRWERFVGFLGRHDLFYAVPTAIAVAAFIIAILAYFGSVR